MRKEAAPPTRTWTIAELARELEISTRTIRFYEEKGLITPERTSGNRRVYSKRDRARLKLILRGKRFGYSLEEIGEMIGMGAVDLAEAEQIRRSLAYGDKKLGKSASASKNCECWPGISKPCGPNCWPN